MVMRHTLAGLCALPNVASGCVEQATRLGLDQQLEIHDADLIQLNEVEEALELPSVHEQRLQSAGIRML